MLKAIFDVWHLLALLKDLLGNILAKAKPTISVFFWPGAGGLSIFGVFFFFVGWGPSYFRAVFLFCVGGKTRRRPFREDGFVSGFCFKKM